MQITEEQTKNLRSWLVRNMPLLQTEGEGPSGRLEDQWVENADQDTRGYRAVFIYIGQGLGNEDQLLRQVLHIVALVQRKDRLKYPVRVSSFGWDDGKLHDKKFPMDGTYLSAGEKWALAACNLAGTTTAVSPVVIPSLSPLIKKDDLLLFFSRSRDVRMAEAAANRYTPRAIKHSIWVFCAQDVLLEMGRFTPKTEGIRGR